MAKLVKGTFINSQMMVDVINKLIYYVLNLFMENP